MLPSRIFFDDFFDDFNKPKRNIMNCDISEKDGKYIFEIDLPGITKQDIKMDIDNGYLTISVESSKDEVDDDKKYLHRERHSYTSCSRQFYVGEVNEDEIVANFKDGILYVTVPKEEKKESKKIINID